MTNIDKMDINPKDKNILEKVAEKAVEGVKKASGAVVESFDNSKFKMKTVDKIKTTWNSGLLNKYDNKSVKMMTKRNSAEEKLKLLTNKNEEGERRIANLQKEYKDSHGEILLKIEGEFSKERKRYFDKIEKTKNKIDKIKIKEEYYKTKGEVYENKTKNIIGGVLNKVEKRLNPHEVKIEDLKNKIGILSSEAKNFELAKVKLGEKVENLKKKLEVADFKAEKKGIKRIIGEIENEMRRTEKIRLGRLEEQSKMENKLAKVSKKVNKWNAIRNQFSRIITERPTRVEHKNMGIKIERPDLKNVEIGDKKKKRSKKEEGGESESSSRKEGGEWLDRFNKKGLDFIKQALESGCDKSSIALGLAGLDSKEAWDLRKQLLEKGVNKNDIASGLAGLDSKEAWDLRRQFLAEDVDKDSIALGLAGLDSKEAWDLRNKFLAGGVNRSIIVASLAGLDSKEAWDLRKQSLLEVGDKKSDIVLSLSGLDSKEAWDLRKKLLEKPDNYKSIAFSLSGLDSKEAWDLRKQLLEKGVDKSVKGSMAIGLAGLDSKEAWDLRRQFLAEGVNKDSIALGLSGLDSKEAWDLRTRFIVDGVDLGSIAKGLFGNRITFFWRLQEKSRENIDKKKKRSKKEEGGGSESSSEREPVFSLKEYVENWNKYFGSQFKIDSNLFLAEALDKKMEIPFLEDHIRMIYKKKKESDKSSVGSFPERDLEKSLKSLNNYL